MMKLARLLLFPLSLTAGQLAAQMAGPAPLAGAADSAGNAPGGWIVAEGRADAALQSGFPATAAEIYREILREPALPAETRSQATLALVTAQLDAGEIAEAEKILQAYPGPRDAGYQLRAGLIAANARRKDAAKAALAAGKVEDLTPADKGWWYFVQALVADMDNDFTRRDAAFAQANAAAVSELQRTRINLSHEQVLLKNVPLDEARVSNLRQTMEKYPGQRTGYEAARSYAAALALLGRNGEALAVLQRQLAVLPATERNVGDQMRLTLGMVAGEGSVAGRQAFKQLLRDGQKPETQRLALHLLDRGAKTTSDREQLRRDLSELIGAPVQNPVIEDMLLVRAQAALVDHAYAQAEEDARALLDRYPGSLLRTAALGVRLAVAWEGKRYRTAADVIAQLRTMLAPGRERAELGVLLAEAFFLAEDYKNAADAYDAALHEAPAVVPAGKLIFQRVLADIRADQLDSAAKQLDEAAANPAFDAVSRWQAEWNLVKEMQVRGAAQAAAAYERVNRLLTSGAQGVPDDLRIRLMWLRAKLSFDNDKLEEAQAQADELLKLLQQGGQFEPVLRTNVTSMALLLKAQALLALKRDAEGFALFEKLRKDFQATDAAQYSYLVHAGYLTQRGDIAAAQGVLNSFVDNPAYRGSDYAPLALYESALNEERLGLERNLRDAYKKLERLIQDYPRDELVFYARLKQGDLLRKLNDFPAARQIYEDLVNNPVPHPDVLLAQIALANCLYAQSTNSPVNYEGALAIFERLRDLPTAPVDLRAEAGFDWGYALAKRDQAAKAQAVFWAVANDFLLDASQAAKLGAKGRWWVAKSLLELAKIHEDAGRLDEAQRVYQLIIDQKLSGQALAQDKLARFRAAGGAKP
ncbi:MAG: Anaphase-promoting complex, cyclosome, subunit 3 [Lacunisphaera sp.]|nr:Anaphase-promoting complex, cyclosome, subunit 3 [Lacunisphaera sp.]MDB6166887.1 Anaphase-promoting complex, cyclosome, subunit 3 [Lacunisphaera sp.]